MCVVWATHMRNNFSHAPLSVRVRYRAEIWALRTWDQWKIDSPSSINWHQPGNGENSLAGKVTMDLAESSSMSAYCQVYDYVACMLTA